MNQRKTGSKQSKLENPPRRQWLRNMLLLALTAGFSSCRVDSGQWGFSHSKVKKRYHWLRRQEWTGLEAVYGVARIEDRYLLVKHTNGFGWAFPWGIVDPKVYGEKKKDNQDLIHTVTDYVHTQAVIPVIGDEAILLAYGYALDPVRDRTYLQHWIHVTIPGGFPPNPYGNLNDTQDAKWVALDDPELGSCLRKRIQEYQSIGEGGSIILEPCME